jgi:hypothetical protein
MRGPAKWRSLEVSSICSLLTSIDINCRNLGNGENRSNLILGTTLAAATVRGEKGRYMDRTFEVRCNAGEEGHLNVKTNSLSIRVGQCIQRNGTDEMWDSVLVLCEKGDDGALTTKVVICHPDWDQQLQIASIESGSASRGKAAGVLSCDFTQVHI